MERVTRGRAFLLVNPGSGTGSPTAGELVAEAAKRGLQVRELDRDDDAETLAREAAAAGAVALGVAGGDGSLAPVAQVALDADLPFVPVPYGTRNHFARDVGLERDDPIGALEAFQGAERRVDVGFAQDRLFLNNVSLGLYASLVHDPARETKNRVVAALRLIPASLGRSRRPLTLRFEQEGRWEEHRALLCQVANNAYELSSMAEFGVRPRLDEGLLHAYVIEAVSRRALLALLARAAAKRLGEAEGWHEWASPTFTVDAKRPRIHAALDGEPTVLEPPITFEVRPRALRILVPTRLRDGATEDTSRT